MSISAVSSVSPLNLNDLVLVQEREDSQESSCVSELGKRSFSQISEQDPFDVPRLIDKASRSLPGKIALLKHCGSVYIVGKMLDHRSIVAIKGNRIGLGGSAEVFSICTRSGSLDEYVLKVVRRKSADFSLDEKILQGIHFRRKSPYVADCFVATMLSPEGNRIYACLQKREGLDLSVLSRQDGRPPVSFVVQALKQISDSFKEMGIGDLDQKPANYALSADGKRLVKIDVGGFFDMESFTSTIGARFVWSSDYMPAQGFLWLKWIDAIKKFFSCKCDISLTLLRYNISLEADFKKKIFSVLEVPDNVSEDRFWKFLKEEQKKTIDCIMNYQLGLVAYLYITKNKERFPYGLNYLMEGRAYQEISEQKNNFKTPSGWGCLSSETRNMIRGWLSSEPFLKMHQKYKSLNGVLSIKLNPEASLRLNATGIGNCMVFNTSNNKSFDVEISIECYLLDSVSLAESKGFIPVYELNSSKFVCLKEESLESELEFSLNGNVSIKYLQDALTAHVRQFLLDEQKTKISLHLIEKIPDIQSALLASLVEFAFSCPLGTLQKYTLENKEFFLGKTSEGDVVIGVAGASLRPNKKIHCFFDYMNERDPEKFVLKRNESIFLSHEDRILADLNRGEASNGYFPSPFIAKNIEQAIALQKRKGDSLFLFRNREDRPDVDFLLECMEAFYSRMCAKGIADVNVTLDDFVVCYEEQKVVKVNFQDSFYLDGFLFNNYFVMRDSFPIEALVWQRILRRASENEGQNSLFNPIMQVLGVEQALPLEEKMRHLQKECNDSIKKAMLFQMGSIVFEYLMKTKDKTPYPTKKDRRLGVDFPKVTQSIKGEIKPSVDINTISFPTKVPDKMLLWLDAEPFVEMEKRGLAVLEIAARGCI